MDFFVYDVLLSRPHGYSGTGGTGLSREEYERYTKEIRFRSIFFFGGGKGDGGRG